MSGQTPRVTNTIARSLDEGWHFRPNWRSAIVEAYLLEKQLQQPPLEALKDEEDPYVRQFYLFRRCGRCLEQSAFQWAYSCFLNNPTTGAASLIRALTVARVPVNEIAEKLRTSRKNIRVFQKVYFDIGRYMDEEAWLASVVFAPSQNPQDPVEFRERHWMAAAFLRGERGLGQAFLPKVPVSPEESAEMLSEIKSVVTARSYEFVATLRTELVPPSHHDFDRLMKLLDVAARQPVADEDRKSYDRMLDSLDSLIDATRKAAGQPENANNRELQEIRAALDDSAAPKTAQKVLSW